MNIRISINKQSGRLIEVALYLNKGMLAWTSSKLGEHTLFTLLVVVLRKYRAPSGPCCLVDAVGLSRLELSCAINLLSNQASVLIAMSCRGSVLFLRAFSMMVA
jgi:hypothetical protein